MLIRSSRALRHRVTAAALACLVGLGFGVGAVSPAGAAVQPEPSPSPEETTDVAPEESGTAAPAPSPRALREMSILAAGVPEAPVEVWAERFAEVGGSALVRLPDYASGAYTADTFWLDYADCNGVLVTYNTALAAGATECTSTNATNQQNARVNIRRMADVLGQVDAGVTGGTSAAPANGSTAATRSNRALAEWTSSGTGAAGGTRMLDRVTGTGVANPAGGYFTASIDIVEASCTTASARSQIALALGGTTLTSSPITACTDARSAFYTSPLVSGQTGWVYGGDAVRAGRFTAAGSVRVAAGELGSLRPTVRNLNLSSGGNDVGVDNLRILDVTPSLDVAFGDESVVAGTPTTLTYTVTNTGELAGKTDWGFANPLPTGLRVAAMPNVGGTCTSGSGTAYSVVAAAGSSSVTVAGADLAAGAQSCTVTVDVVAAEPGTYENGADDVSTILVAPEAATLVVDPRTTVTLQKNVTARTAATDQFTLSLRSGSTVLASATTTGTATGVQSARIDAFTVTPGAQYTIHEQPTSGAGLGYGATYECLRDGTVIASGASTAGSLTIPDEPGAQVVCTFTNTPQPAAFACDATHFSSVSQTGAVVQGDIVTGGTVAAGGWSNQTNVNGLGVGDGGTVAYAFARSTDATSVSAILKWSSAGGYQTLSGTAYTPRNAAGAAVAGSLVAGAVDLENNRYIFGKFNSGRFHLWSFTEANPTASRFAYLGSFATGSSPNGNGDMAFDDRGNLYVLGAAAVSGANSAAIYTVTAATLAAAAGGDLAVNASTTKSITGTESSPAFGNANGIAFSSRGTAFLSDGQSAYEFDPTTWTRVAGSPRVALTSSTDLAGCASPATLAVQKNVVGRAAGADQFTLTASADGATIATATTAGSATGVQAAQIGPLPVPVGRTVGVSEAMAAGSSSPIGAYTRVYECWSDGVRLSTGSSESGQVTMPDRLGAAVTCTFFNSPRPASTVTVTKRVLDPATGQADAASGWTVGVSAQATTGTATALPSEAPRQQTGANGSAVWTVLFGSTASRATLTISEVQQTGYLFVGATCTVDGANRSVSFAQSGQNVSGTLTGIAASSTVACTITNRPVATLTLVKDVAFGAADASEWLLAATGPTTALPGPSGAGGTTRVDDEIVSPGVPYRLSESGGPDTYVQTAGWTCVDGSGAAVAVTDDGAVTLARGASVTCTVTNATARLTLVKQVDQPRPGFQPQDWEVTAAPEAADGLDLPTETVVGAEYAPGENAASTVDVRPGHPYTLSEELRDPDSALAYRQVRLERLEGSTWVPVASTSITAPAAGQSAVYRFVNAPVNPTELPLTGGQSTDAYLLGGGAVLLAALSLAGFHGWRRTRRSAAVA